MARYPLNQPIRPSTPVRDLTGNLVNPTAVTGKVDVAGFEYNADANGAAGAWTCDGWKLGY